MGRKELRLESVTFTRTENGPEELGVLVNEGDGPLIDMDGKVVREGGCWDHRRTLDHVMTITEEVADAAGKR